MVAPFNLGNARINPDLLPLVRPIDWFKPDPGNLREHPEQSIAGVAHSLEDFEQSKNIVALEDGTIVAGHATWEAAKRLGWRGLAAVVFHDYAKAEAFALADNRTAELSLWSSKLSERLKELAAGGLKLERIGFDAAAIKAITVREHDRNTSTNDDVNVPQLGAVVFRVVVECVDESDQVALMQRLDEEGRKCRALMS